MDSVSQLFVVACCWLGDSIEEKCQVMVCFLCVYRKSHRLTHGKIQCQNVTMILLTKLLKDSYFFMILTFLFSKLQKRKKKTQKLKTVSHSVAVRRVHDQN